MKNYRVQKNITASKREINLLKKMYGKVKFPKLCKIVGISYNKARNNLKLLGIINPKEHQQKKMQLSRHSYFNEKNFFKYYKY